MAQPTVNKIGKYEVVDVLGKGGMGVVYKATDPRIGRLVAIKMMTGGFAENPDLLKRFYREAQSTGMLQHPNIVIVYDLGDQDGNPYLVMEYLQGEPLDKLIATRRELSMVQKLDYIIQGLNGLNYAHQKGIVHRDIKPANLMILNDGTVKIVDFGIARIGDQSLTRTGQVVGTITFALDGPNAYGYRPLVEGLASHCRVSPDMVVTSSGGTSMANHLAMAALVGHGDEVLIEEPTYEPLLAIAGYLGAGVRRFPRRFADGFRVDVETLAKRITPRTRLIVLTNLHNPSSVVTGVETDRKSTRLNSSHIQKSRMPSSA